MTHAVSLPLLHSDEYDVIFCHIFHARPNGCAFQSLCPICLELSCQYFIKEKYEIQCQYLFQYENSSDSSRAIYFRQSLVSDKKSGADTRNIDSTAMMFTVTLYKQTIALLEANEMKIPRKIVEKK